MGQHRIVISHKWLRASQVALVNLPANAGDARDTGSIPGWGKSPGIGDGNPCKRLGFASCITKIPWRKRWQLTPVFLSRKFHGQRSLVGYHPWGHRVRHDWSNWPQHTVHKHLKHQEYHWEFGKSCSLSESSGVSTVHRPQGGSLGWRSQVLFLQDNLLRSLDVTWFLFSAFLSSLFTDILRTFVILLIY